MCRGLLRCGYVITGKVPTGVVATIIHITYYTQQIPSGKRLPGVCMQQRFSYTDMYGYYYA